MKLLEELLVTVFQMRLRNLLFSLLSPLIKMFQMLTLPQEILDTELYFIDAIGLAANLSPTRANGLAAMVKQMRLYALAFQAKSNS